MKVRVAGLILIALLTLAAIASWVHLVVRVVLVPDGRAREMLGGLDVFGNTGMFNGSRFETISSHTGRECLRGTRWALWLSAGLDLLQKGHCAGANALEQPLLDAIEAFDSHAV